MNAVTIQLQTCSPEFPSAERFIELYGCFNWVWDNLLNFFYQVWIVSNNNDNKGLGELGYSSACGLFIAYVRLKKSQKSWSTLLLPPFHLVEAECKRNQQE